MATSPARRRRGGRCDARAAAFLAASALVFLAPPLAARATSASDLYYERTVMRAADARCRLFSPDVAAALAAASLQARGAALRAGTDKRDLDAAGERAAVAAGRVGCSAPDLAVAADRVRKAFDGYARLGAMRFPGELSAWQADRNPTAQVVNRKAVDGPRWRLSEPGQWSGGGGAVTLGLAGDNAAPTVVSSESGAAMPSAAFLVLRDPAKAEAPYIDPRRRDLAGRTPPAAITRSFVAAVRESAPASLASGGVLFAFPTAAAQALAALDPREVATVEFTYPDRPSRRAVFEVGDFAAARAFLLARR